MISTDEILRAMRQGSIKELKCPECNGTGTKYGQMGKSRQCPVCKGTRKVVLVPRDPVLLPMNDEWKWYFRN